MSEVEKNQLDIYFLHVVSDVQSRFATTEIQSRIANRLDTAKEATFTANLPNAAFISYFEMEVNGKVIVGEVKEKEKAKQVYQAAKLRGETAGHVAQKVREANKFEISVNIKGGEEAKFKLVYQELLQRVRGVYKHQINIQPGQVVRDLQVDVHISEQLPFRVLHIPKFASKLDAKSNKDLLQYNKASDDVTVNTSSEEKSHKAWIHWRPTEERQKELCGDGILDGQLVLLYDVEREEDSGELQVVNGYFIHYFAPNQLDIGSKNIIFALDISGSMAGFKLEQTKEAMKAVLMQLRSNDSFNVIVFNNGTYSWKNKSESATEDAVHDAKAWIANQKAGGGTDINKAVQESITQLIRRNKSHFFSAATENVLDQLIILLTDGQHNGNCSEIGPRAVKTIKDNKTDIKIFGLAFGEDADFDLLKDLASKTGAVARKIYSDSDAALQLENFYEEISSPLLANLKIRYLDPNVDAESIVQNCAGNTYYDGSEMVYAGKLSDSAQSTALFPTEIEARGANGPFQRTQQHPVMSPFPDLVPSGNTTDIVDSSNSAKPGAITMSMGDIIERSWAYLTIKSLLERAETNSSETDGLKQKALELSLKYGFVTGVTSMVAVQPSEDNKEQPSSTLNFGVDAVSPLNEDYYSVPLSVPLSHQLKVQCSYVPVVNDLLDRSENLRCLSLEGMSTSGLAECSKDFSRATKCKKSSLISGSLFGGVARSGSTTKSSVKNFLTGASKYLFKGKESTSSTKTSSSDKQKKAKISDGFFHLIEKAKQQVAADNKEPGDTLSRSVSLRKWFKTDPESLKRVLSSQLRDSDTKQIMPQVTEAVQKINEVEKATEVDILIWSMVAAGFSADSIQEIFSSMLILDSANTVMVQGSYPYIDFTDPRVLMIKWSIDSTNAKTEVESGSLFHALDIIYKLMGMEHCALPGAQQLIHFIYQAEVDPVKICPDFDEKLFMAILKKFKEC